MITIEQMIKSRDFSAVNTPDKYAYVFLSILDGNTCEETAQLLHEDLGYPAVLYTERIRQMFNKGHRYLYRYAHIHDTDSIFIDSFGHRNIYTYRKCIINNVYTLEGLHNLIEEGVINDDPYRPRCKSHH